MTATSTLMLRPARDSDARKLMRLAALDTAPVPRGDVMLAEVDGEAVAALDMRSGAVVANPFRRTDDVVRALTALAA